MSDQPPSSADKPGAPVNEPPSGAVFEPYESPAGGWGALEATARALREQSVAIKGRQGAAFDESAPRLRLPGMRVA